MLMSLVWDVCLMYPQYSVFFWLTFFITDWWDTIFTVCMCTWSWTCVHLSTYQWNCFQKTAVDVTFKEAGTCTSLTRTVSFLSFLEGETRKLAMCFNFFINYAFKLIQIVFFIPVFFLYQCMAHIFSSVKIIFSSG